METSVKRMVVMVAVMAVAIGALVGCAKLPQAALDQAKAALDQADQAQAATYAPQAWEQAQQAMNAATAEIETQKAKSALGRSYKKASELLATANQQAIDAQKAAVAGKEQARTEAEQLVTEVKSGLDQANQLLEALSKCRRRPKGFASDLELLRGKVNGLTQQLPDVQSALGKENYMDAKTLATQLKEQVDSVVADMEKAKAKIKC